MAKHFMQGVPPRHTHGENRVKGFVIRGCISIWLAVHIKVVIALVAEMISYLGLSD